ncbi:MAG: chromosomal replication initiator protein DnaA [Tidjanibacter sp.]|jgi:chromosomal replication initiator protein|nr:chromosomal replication initiator protein DnaA [Tidjanibacter sp.]
MIQNSATYNDVWQDCLARIRKQTSDEEFAKWFQPIVPIGFDGQTLRLRLPSEECVYHIEHNYIPSLRPIIYELFGDKTRLRYSVPQAGQAAPQGYTPTEASTKPMAQAVAQNDTAKIKNPFIIPGIKKLVIDSQLNPNYTFETFVEGECNRLVRSVGLAVAIEPGKNAYNPLYIFGDSGLGKTHLAQAIGMEIKQRHPELQVLYVSMNKFQAQYTTAVLNKEPNDFINFYQMVDVLIIDDIQELSGNKSSTQNAFFNIFNHLHLTGKQLILTSDKRPSELSDINDRLLTRFKWGLAAELTQPDYQTKVKIIRNKAERLGAQIPDEVVAYFAENINANIREIEGALSALVANSAFLNRKITISLAKEVLKMYVKICPKEITIEQVRKIVCEQLDIDEAAFDSPKRTREIAQARQIAMYICKQHTKASLSAIGSAIGGKNHATVLHACKAVTNLMETDKAFAQTVEEIERIVLAK